MLNREEVTQSGLSRREQIASGRSVTLVESPDGIELRVFVSGACGAVNLYTGSATFRPGAVLPFHTHQVSEALVILEGNATVTVENRSYRLGPLDCIHLPAQVAHSVRNNDPSRVLIGHSSFAAAEPSRTFAREDRSAPRYLESPGPADPESIRRFETAEKYWLSEGALFCDLFAKRFGSIGICGGYGRFDPGASLPCHLHQYDESITIVLGEARCQVQGNEYPVSGLDTAFVPEGLPHRFINAGKEPMAMIWVYAGDEPDRTLIDAGYCSGSIAWPGVTAYEGEAGIKQPSTTTP